jgi:glycosyltransferase involved in cell wall biosynthesis
MNPLLALRSTWLLWRYFRRECFDVVHVHTPVAALIGRVAAFFSGVPLVIYTAHGFYFHDDMPAWKRRLFVWIERFGGWMTDLLFSQSQEDADDAVKEGIASQARVTAIGNGVAISRFDPSVRNARAGVRESLGIPADAFVIGMIGRQVREKGVAEFLQAAARVAQSCPGIYFLLIGERLASDHAAGVEVEFAAARAALGNRLVAPGLRADIPEMLAAMDAFCLPSWREGMPRTIIEAMMMSLPVVATDIRGSREEIVPEETGLLVPVRDTESLAAAFVRLFDEPLRAAHMGVAGRERALRLYDEDKVVALQLDKISTAAKERDLGASAK